MFKSISALLACLVLSLFTALAPLAHAADAKSIDQKAAPASVGQCNVELAPSAQLTQIADARSIDSMLHDRLGPYGGPKTRQDGCPNVNGYPTYWCCAGSGCYCYFMWANPCA